MKIWKTRQKGSGFVGFRKPHNPPKEDSEIDSEAILEPPPYEELQKPFQSHRTDSQPSPIRLGTSPKTKKRGRPRKSSQHLRYRNISVCLSEHEERAWKKAAKQAHKSLSQWIRDKVNHPEA